MNALRPHHGSDCGCDALGKSPALVSLDQALAALNANALAVAGSEMLKPSQARGRVLAQAVYASADAPPFTNAGMDGYAVNTGDLTGAGPWDLPVTARIAAGQGSDVMLPGRAARIFTGAPVPSGANAVIMQEAVDRVGDRIRLQRCPAVGENIRHRGEDLARGDEVLGKGTFVNARVVAACVAAGVTEVAVRRRISVALIVTGNEVAGAASGPGQVPDVNGPMIAALLDRPDCELVAHVQVADRADELTRTLAELARKADLIVTTGGISVGEEDHVKPAFLAAGGRIIFSGVAVKPGKPVSMGRLGSSLWLGLPGNPHSAFAVWQVFGTQIMRRLAGQSGSPWMLQAITGADIRHRAGRSELRPVRVMGQDTEGRIVVQPAAAVFSGRIAGLAAMDGYVIVPADAGLVPEGTTLPFQFYSDFRE